MENSISITSPQSSHAHPLALRMWIAARAAIDSALLQLSALNVRAFDIRKRLRSKTP